MPRTDTATRVICAPVADVYSALVDPEALVVWLPPGDMTGTIERFDLRPGGSYRMVLQHPGCSSSQGKTTSDTDVVEARFVDLVPNSRVVWAVDFVSDDPVYDNPMIMRWEVTAADGGTCVEITAEACSRRCSKKTTMQRAWGRRWQSSTNTSPSRAIWVSPFAGRVSPPSLRDLTWQIWPDRPDRPPTGTPSSTSLKLRATPCDTVVEP